MTAKWGLVLHESYDNQYARMEEEWKKAKTYPQSCTARNPTNTHIKSKSKQRSSRKVFSEISHYHHYQPMTMIMKYINSFPFVFLFLYIITRIDNAYLGVQID